MPTGMTDAILGSTTGVDVALYGLRAPQEDSAGRIGGAVVLRAGAKGQYLGRLTIGLGDAHEIRSVSADTRALDESFPKDPQWTARVARGVAEADSARANYLRRDQEAFDALFRQ
jgi:2',3'-cyclic-nucleotide 2'-phosphodiesterase (5'-nucleotidase family)